MRQKLQVTQYSTVLEAKASHVPLLTCVGAKVLGNAAASLWQKLKEMLLLTLLVAKASGNAAPYLRQKLQMSLMLTSGDDNKLQVTLPLVQMSLLLTCDVAKALVDAAASVTKASGNAAAYLCQKLQITPRLTCGKSFRLCRGLLVAKASDYAAAYLWQKLQITPRLLFLWLRIVMSQFFLVFF